VFRDCSGCKDSSGELAEPRVGRGHTFYPSLGPRIVLHAEPRDMLFLHFSPLQYDMVLSIVRSIKGNMACVI
jgi:hypothetical protein